MTYQYKASSDTNPFIKLITGLLTLVLFGAAFGLCAGAAVWTYRWVT